MALIHNIRQGQRSCDAIRNVETLTRCTYAHGDAGAVNICHAVIKLLLEQSRSVRCIIGERGNNVATDRGVEVPNRSEERIAWTIASDTTNEVVHANAHARLAKQSRTRQGQSTRERVILPHKVNSVVDEVGRCISLSETFRRVLPDTVLVDIDVDLAEERCGSTVLRLNAESRRDLPQEIDVRTSELNTVRTRRCRVVHASHHYSL